MISSRNVSEMNVTSTDDLKKEEEGFVKPKNLELFEILGEKTGIDLNNLQDSKKNKDLILFTQKYLHLKYLVMLF